MATVTHLQHLETTTGDVTYTTAAFTPTADDLLGVWCAVTAEATDDWVVTDSLGGTWTKVIRVLRSGSASQGAYWIRDSLAPASSMTVTFSHSTPAATGGSIHVHGVAGMSKTGATAIRGSGGQSNQASATTPAPVLSLTPDSANPVVSAINVASQTETTGPASYTTLRFGSHGAPNASHKSVKRDSGETSATITWGGTAPAAFCSVAIEFDSSGAAVVLPPRGLVLQDAVNRAYSY